MNQIPQVLGGKLQPTSTLKEFSLSSRQSTFNTTWTSFYQNILKKYAWTTLQVHHENAIIGEFTSELNSIILLNHQ